MKPWMLLLVLVGSGMSAATVHAQTQAVQQPLALTQGQPVEIDLGQGRWQRDAQRWVWRYRLQSSGTRLIAFAAQHRLPPGAVLTMRSDGGVVRQERPGATPAAMYYSPPLPGDTLDLELRADAPLADDAFRIVTRYVGTVSAKSDIRELPPTNLLCDLSPEVARPARSTVGLVISSASGQVRCSGTLVNDMTGTGAHRLLTAAHCGDGAAHDAAGVRAYWNATSNCAEDSVEFQATDVPTSIGYRTLAVADVARIDQANGNFQSITDGDHWLIASDTPPPLGSAPVWAGLDARVMTPPGIDPTYYPTSMIPATFSLSHPMALTQSIARFRNADEGGQYPRMRNGLSCFSFGEDGYDCRSSYSFYYDARGYSVRPGSSGGALRLPEGRVIGVLASCGEPTEINPNNGQPVQACQYDKLSSVWTGDRMGSPRLDTWLDPQSTGRRVSDEFIDASRSDNLGVQFATGNLNVAAGGVLSLQWLLDEAVRCRRQSTPALADWEGEVAVVNGDVDGTRVTLPTANEYRLDLSCDNAAGFTVRRSVVVNPRSTPVSPPPPPTSGGGEMGGNDSGGGSGGGALTPLSLLLLTLFALLRGRLHLKGMRRTSKPKFTRRDR